MDIGGSYPEHVSEFAELMEHKDEHIRLYAAISVAEYMPHTVAQLTVIKTIIMEHMTKCGEAEIMGWNWWLKQPWACLENCVDYDGSDAVEAQREEES